MATQQSPIHSGFGAATTAAEVIRGINLKDKTAIITGGYSGLGLETTKALVSAGEGSLFQPDLMRKLLRH